MSLILCPAGRRGLDYSMNPFGLHVFAGLCSSTYDRLSERLRSGLEVDGDTASAAVQ